MNYANGTVNAYQVTTDRRALMIDDNKGFTPRRGARRARTSDPNEAISRQLKSLYSSLEQEQIPDRFLDLLEQLDEAEKAASGKSGS